MYQVRDNKLHQITERETKGAVFCLNAFQVGSNTPVQAPLHICSNVRGLLTYEANWGTQCLQISTPAHC